MSQLPNLHLRWAIKRDLPEIFAIEKAELYPRWSAEEFTNTCRKANCISLVAELGETVIGHMVYQLTKDSVRVVHMIVAESQRRRGVGTAMLERMRRKINVRYRQLAATVPETNLDMQLFLRSFGFLATEILPGHFSGEDAYEMSFGEPEVVAVDLVI